MKDTQSLFQTDVDHARMKDVFVRVVAGALPDSAKRAIHGAAWYDDLLGRRATVRTNGRIVMSKCCPIAYAINTIYATSGLYPPDTSDEHWFLKAPGHLIWDAESTNENLKKAGSKRRIASTDEVAQAFTWFIEGWDAGHFTTEDLIALFPVGTEG